MFIYKAAKNLVLILERSITFFINIVIDIDNVFGAAICPVPHQKYPADLTTSSCAEKR